MSTTPARPPEWRSQAGIELYPVIPIAILQEKSLLIAILILISIGLLTIYWLLARHTEKEKIVI